MPAPTGALICAVCSDIVDPAEAHWLHDDRCPRRRPPADDLFCDCDKVAHPDCCPDCTGRSERSVNHRGFTFTVQWQRNIEGLWRITVWNPHGKLAARRRGIDAARLDEVEQQLLEEAAKNEPPHRAAPLAYGVWLLAIVAKRMAERPDGTADVTLPADMVAMLKDFIADQAARP